MSISSIPGFAFPANVGPKPATINESSFFRDGAPFELFSKTMLPYFRKTYGSRKKLRIWSAACSAGQEAYSLAMLVKDQMPQLQNWQIDIVGTDISQEMINQGKAGTYSELEIQDLPTELLHKHFNKDGDKWTIDNQIRQMVQLTTLDLLQPFSTLGQFDIIFCRNVLTYFPDAIKSSIIIAISKQISPDGFLVLGINETIHSNDGQFNLINYAGGLDNPSNLLARTMAN
jgi:chemotaxis protein methyltransferase CheR